MKLTNEFSLAAACCRWPPSDERDRAVEAAASHAIDWQRFLRIVRRQRVEGLVSDALTRAHINAAPEVAAELRRQAQEIALKNLGFAAEALRLNRILEEAGITALFVKGVTLDSLAYGSLGLKRARDIDLIIAPDVDEAACAGLADAG